MITHGIMTKNEQSVMYNCIVASMVALTYLDKRKAVGNDSQFNAIGFYAIIINFILIILIKAVILTNPIPILVAFNGGILLATIMVLVSGIRHGYFSKKYNG